LVHDLRHDRLEGVRRGDLAAVALQGEQGKPRPALVVQFDLFSTLSAAAWRNRDGLRTIDVQPQGCQGKRYDVASAETKLPAAMRYELRNQP